MLFKSPAKEALNIWSNLTLAPDEMQYSICGFYKLTDARLIFRRMTGPGVAADDKI